ncbi:META domain-containing protein [Chitinophagaceae bacterium MMS25-I14]
MRNTLFAILICAALAFSSCGASQHQQNESNRTINIEEAASQLQNKRWILTRLADTSFPKPKKDIYIQFENNNLDLKGFGGCNGFGGTYAITSKGLTISRLLSTQMWCDMGTIEQKLMAALQTCNNFQVTADQLMLVNGKKPLAYFTAVYLK